MKGPQEIEYAKIWPIQEIGDKFFVNGNGDLTFSYRLELPEVYTVSRTQYNDLHDKLVNAIKQIPNGCCVHKQDIYYVKPYKYDLDKSYNFTKKKDLEHFSFRGMLNHYSLIHFTFSVNEKLKVDYSNNSLITKRDYFFSNPFKNVEKSLEEAVDKAEGFESYLRAIKEFTTRKLSKTEITKELCKIWNLEFGDELTSLQLDPMSIDKKELKIGNKFVGMVSLTGEGDSVSNYARPQLLDNQSFPKPIDINSDVELDTSFAFPIGLGLPINHIVNTIIEVVDSEKMSSKLKATSRGLNFFTALGKEGAEEKKESLDVFISAVNIDNARACLLRQNVVVFDTDQSIVKKHLNLVKIAFSNMRSYTAMIENFQTANLLLASYPGNSKANFRTLITTVKHAVCMLPMETHLKSDSNGVMFTDRFGRPIVLDLKETNKINNKNKLVFGGSGSGKSFWLNHYVSECIQMNYHIILMDKGGSFKETFAIAGGHYIDSSDYKSLTFNIFLCNQDPAGNYIYSVTDEDNQGGSDKINFIIVILQKIWKSKMPFLDTELAVIRKLITAFYEYINREKLFPSLNLFGKFVNIFENEMEELDKKYVDFQHLRNALESYTGTGEYAFLLNSETRMDINAYRLVAIDLEGVEGNPMLYDIVSYIIVELASSKIMSLPKSTPKMLLVDEAVDFLTGATGAFVGDQFRKIRKKGGEVIIATQAVDFLNTVEPIVKQSLQRNSDTKILVGLGTEPGALADAKEFLNLTNQDIEIIQSLQQDATKKV